MPGDEIRTTPALACTGCGSRWTDAELAERRQAGGILSCCPERDMQPAPETTISRREWIAAYRAAFCRISVERGIWTAEGALPWAESCEDDAWAAAGHCEPAEVAAEDVDVCRKERE